MQKAVLAIAVVAALVAPSLARAGDVSMHVRDVPLGARSLAAAQPSRHFTMLAVHWTGASGGLQFRVRGTVRRLRSYEVWSRVTTAPVRALSQAGTPAIVSRA